MLHILAVILLSSFYLPPAGLQDDGNGQDTGEWKPSIRIETAVYMEGPMRRDGYMHTNLYERGYLPGQKPKTFFGKSTKPGQPYNRTPWNYKGREGSEAQKDAFNYPPKTVDWILVSLLSNAESFKPLWTASAILLNDGSVMLAPNAPACLVDPEQSYFITIEHRNHLGVISHAPVSVVDGVLSYDFRTLGDYNARLTGLKIAKDGHKVMAAGNGDQVSDHLTSFSIDEKDLALWRNENGRNSQYLMMDLDFSGDVSVKDQELLFNNYGITTAVMIPH